MLINVLRGEMSIVGLHSYRLPPSHLNVQLELAPVTRYFRPGLVSLRDPQTVVDSELSRRNADLFLSRIGHYSSMRKFFFSIFSPGKRTFKITCTANLCVGAGRVEYRETLLGL